MRFVLFLTLVFLSLMCLLGVLLCEKVVGVAQAELDVLYQTTAKNELSFE